MASPAVQVASAQAELAQKVLLVPAAPSSLNASLSLGAIGIMVRCLLLHPRPLTKTISSRQADNVNWRPGSAFAFL